MEYRINRRTVLKASALGVGMMALGGPRLVSGRVAGAAPETYTLSQGGTDYEVTPVTHDDGDGNLVPIEDFYNYAASPNLGGSNTPIGIEENNGSRMFLYRDDTGLYVVFLHDDYWAEGDTATKDWQAYFTFSGLPAGGSWVIDEGNDPGDDFGDGDQFYWRWYPRWSDGGAYGLLSCEPGSEFNITVTPDFNPNPDGETFVEAPASEAWLATDGWKFYDGSGDLLQLDETAELTIACDACDPCAFEGTRKFEFEYDDEEELDGFYLEDGSPFGVDFDEYDSKEGEVGEPLTAYFDSEICADQLTATVKAGKVVDEVEVTETDDGRLAVSVDFEDSPFVHSRNGQYFAISYVEFVCDQADAE